MSGEEQNGLDAKDVVGHTPDWEKKQLSLHVFGVQPTSKDPKKGLFVSVLCPWPPRQWGKSNSSVSWAPPSAENSGEEDQLCPRCREGLWGSQPGGRAGTPCTGWC